MLNIMHGAYQFSGSIRDSERLLRDAFAMVETVRKSKEPLNARQRVVQICAETFISTADLGYLAALSIAMDCLIKYELAHDPNNPANLA